MMHGRVGVRRASWAVVGALVLIGCGRTAQRAATSSPVAGSGGTDNPGLQASNEPRREDDTDDWSDEELEQEELGLVGLDTARALDDLSPDELAIACEFFSRTFELQFARAAPGLCTYQGLITTVRVSDDPVAQCEGQAAQCLALAANGFLPDGFCLMPPAGCSSTVGEFAECLDRAFGAALGTFSDLTCDLAGDREELSEWVGAGPQIPEACGMLQQECFMSPIPFML